MMSARLFSYIWRKYWTTEPESVIRLNCEGIHVTNQEDTCSAMNVWTECGCAPLHEQTQNSALSPICFRRLAPLLRFPSVHLDHRRIAGLAVTAGTIR